MMDYDIYGSDLSMNDFEPVTSPKPQTNLYPIKFPFIEIEPKELNEQLQQLQKLRLKIQQETFRNQNWMIYKNVRKKKHKLYNLTNEILDEEELTSLEEKMELVALDVFRKLIVASKFQEGLDITRYLSSGTMKIAIQLVE